MRVAGAGVMGAGAMGAGAGGGGGLGGMAREGLMQRALAAMAARRSAYASILALCALHKHAVVRGGCASSCAPSRPAPPLPAHLSTLSSTPVV